MIYNVAARFVRCVSLRMASSSLEFSVAQCLVCGMSWVQFPFFSFLIEFLLSTLNHLLFVYETISTPTIILMNSWYSLLLKILRFVNLNLQKLDERQVVPHSALSFESRTKWEKKNLSQQRVDDKNTRETRNFKEREIYPGTK